ncbi:MAG: hypothetical protein MRZ40_10290 [Ligilactobacillus animalis]|jgi:hypothetical protein|uniref:hypothetical protein n=1 Tax=Ligilactobacillus animalis TaxID=1605 RepID=UPI002431E75B|nr:hypothetical protein [Ligilactobacillus animalis]MCI5942942.1 hypothetical protein [Ligilactobacillus animalis]MDY2993776.1 hypothetical protein [Ligilactobacillus animalis]
MRQLTLAVKTAGKFLKAMEADASLVIAADKKSASASVPADNETAAVLILALLDRVPKEVREIVKEYLNEGGIYRDTRSNRRNQYAKGSK